MINLRSFVQSGPHLLFFIRVHLIEVIGHHLPSLPTCSILLTALFTANLYCTDNYNSFSLDRIRPWLRADFLVGTSDAVARHRLHPECIRILRKTFLIPQLTYSNAKSIYEYYGCHHMARNAAKFGVTVTSCTVCTKNWTPHTFVVIGAARCDNATRPLCFAAASFFSFFIQRDISAISRPIAAKLCHISRVRWRNLVNFDPQTTKNRTVV